MKKLEELDIYQLCTITVALSHLMDRYQQDPSRLRYIQEIYDAVMHAAGESIDRFEDAQWPPT